jgi:CHAT domain-containing protein/tetratricopeptide (TPR) repeat protein
VLAATPRADVDAIGTSHRLLGLARMDAGRYREAERHLQQAVRAHERLRPQPEALADDLDALTEVRLWLEDYLGAQSANDRALARREARGDSDTPGLGRTLELRGLLWQRRGDLQRAKVEVARALAIQERRGAAHPALVRTLVLQGDQLKLEGRHRDAIGVLRRAVAIGETSLRVGHPETANAMRSLAGALHRVAAFAEAKALRERALAMAEAAFGRDHPLVGMQLSDLASSHEAVGDFATSRRLARRALAIYSAAFGPTHIGVLTALNNLGNRYTAIGDYDEAIRLFQRATRAWAQGVQRDHPLFAYALSGLGEALSRQGRHRAAIASLDRALRIWERRHRGDSTDVADVLLLLAECRLALGDRVAADAAIDRAAAIWEQDGTRDMLAEAFLVRARIAAAAGDQPAARAGAERALALATSVFGDSHPRIGTIKVALAESLVATGDATGLPTALEAERIGREHLEATLAYLPERQALTYVAQRPRGLDLALSASPPRSALESVHDAVVRGRSLTLDQMAARRRAAARATDPAIAPLWDALVHATQRLAALAVRGPGDATPAAYREELESARRARERAETALADASLDVREAVERRQIGLGAVRKALPPRSAIVSYVRFARLDAGARTRTSPHYAALVLRAGIDTPDLVVLGGAQAIDKGVTDWRRAVVAVVGPAAPARAEAALRRLGRPLRRQVWDPVAATLAGIEQVFVVPDASLNLLPLAALPTEDGGYLLEAGPTIHYLSAERDLVSPAEPDTEAKGLLAIGGPTYGVPAASRAGSPSNPPTRASTCGSFEDVFFPELPASRREAADVSAIWRRLAGDGVHTLVGPSASEAAFKKLGPGRRILHVATHGFFLGNACETSQPGRRSIGRLNRPGSAPPPAARMAMPENPLLWSGLALAGANRRATRPAADDGILTADEVAALSLDGVEWAVLSACDTGVGEIRVGEGVFGLRRAFRIAGARTVVMSLWEVDDQAARAWMRPLYEGRLESRLSTADAVRHAALTVLRERRTKRQSTHPFYWAAFVAAGDWR